MHPSLSGFTAVFTVGAGHPNPNNQDNEDGDMRLTGDSQELPEVDPRPAVGARRR